jgi:vacuolar protein sorting-associated protein 8
MTEHATPTKQQKLHKNLRYAKHGAVLRHVILKMASSQLASAADRVDAGLPTALAASSLIAVGTSHGIVLIFDSRQTLRWCLGGAAGVGAEFGAVSALR